MTTQLAKYAQTALNQIIGAGLDVDGDFGNLSNIAATNFVANIKSQFLKKNWVFGEFLPIGIRMSDTLTDHFTDWLFMLLPNGEVFFIPFSTTPSTAAEREKSKVLTFGQTGVAILVEQQVVGGWQYCSAWWSGLPFFLQKKSVQIYRDSVPDDKINRDSPIISRADTGVNLHSWKGWLQNILWYKNLALGRDISLSEGCQVTEQDDWNLFLAAMNRKYMIGDFVTYSCINISDLKQPIV